MVGRKWDKGGRGSELALHKGDFLFLSHENRAGGQVGEEAPMYKKSMVFLR